MKKKFCRFAIIFLALGVFLSSCSNSNGSEITNLSDESLRNITSKKEDSILWTRELESVRLTRDYKVNQIVSSKIELNPDIISFANTRHSYIYPSLSGFGSIDTSLLSTELKSFLGQVCSSISKWKLAEVKMSESCEFSIILFKYDVENLWRSVYKKPFPEVNVQVVASPADTGATEAGDEKSTEENKTPEPAGIFSKWVYGQPFISDDFTEVPIRFYSSYGTLDILLYVEKTSDFSVAQIEILRIS